MTATNTNPSAYAKNHWRKFESQAEHDERVERAEHEAQWFFQQATVRQKAAWDRAMADLRGLDAPRYDRARAAANAAWARDTAEAADLLTITCDAIMVHGECPEEISNLWDELEARETLRQTRETA
jgi:hypothetical protein